VDGAGHLFVFGKYSLDEPIRVFASADSGAQFLPMTEQIPNPNALSFAADKQGHLLVGTAGGVFRLESSADPAGTAANQ
jgi:ligand-binding sensor domain-containing protein